MKARSERLFEVVYSWTVFTTVFVWLPIVRIVGRPEGYEWGIFGLRGVGVEGPFGVWVVLAAYAFVMLCYGQRLPRKVYYTMLLGWHVTLTSFMVAGIISMGEAATLQGQALRFEVSLLLVALPVILFTVLAAVWVFLDYREPWPQQADGWAPTEPSRFGAAVVLLLVALVVFRMGNNYNWVTSVAVLMTIVQWILMVGSFKPARISVTSNPPQSDDNIEP
ncbi:MAG: hypothetical protein IH971_10890 [Candidatus Marinimicrobia bacterium]|nr:hypothetical protein [Candidatus Neomarinimicrobiota bacterium]